MPLWPWQAGASTRPYRVTCQRLHRRTLSAEPWTETVTRQVQAINADDAMALLEGDILCDGDDCYGLAAEELK